MPRECPDCQGAGEVNANQTSDPQRDDPQRCGACSGQGVLLSEQEAPIPAALSVRCPGCHARVGQHCLTPSGYDLPNSTHDIRQRDLALKRARDAEFAHLSMVRKAGELRDERDRLRHVINQLAEYIAKPEGTAPLRYSEALDLALREGERPSSPTEGADA